MVRAHLRNGRDGHGGTTGTRLGMAHQGRKVANMVVSRDEYGGGARARPGSRTGNAVPIQSPECRHQGGRATVHSRETTRHDGPLDGHDRSPRLDPRTVRARMSRDGRGPQRRFRCTCASAALPDTDERPSAPVVVFPRKPRPLRPSPLAVLRNVVPPTRPLHALDSACGFHPRPRNRAGYRDAPIGPPVCGRSLSGACLNPPDCPASRTFQHLRTPSEALGESGGLGNAALSEISAGAK